MNTRKLFALFFVLTVQVVLAPVAATAEAMPRIMLVGDSWASLMALFESIGGALDRAGFDQYCETGMETTAGGSTAEEWAENYNGYLDELAVELAAHPTVDIVHLSLGGNDFLGQWRGDMTPAEEEALMTSILADINTVVDFILSQRPDLKVAYCTYDYVNTTRPSATPVEVNQAGVRFIQYLLPEIQAKDRFTMVHNYGVAQYVFGDPPESVPYPGGPPDYDPLPGGNPDEVSPAEIMLDDIGYTAIADNCVEQVYREWLEWPKALEIAPASGVPWADAGLVEFAVTFTEPVTGADPTDFTLYTTENLPEARIVDVYGNNTNRIIVRVDTGEGFGSVGVQLLDDDTVVDGESNPLGGAGTGNHGYVYSETLIITEVPVTPWPLLIVLLGTGLLVVRRHRYLHLKQ